MNREERGRPYDASETTSPFAREQDEAAIISTLTPFVSNPAESR